VTAARVVATVFRNPGLGRVELAFAGFNGAEWGVWLAMLVFAYDQGGATTAGLVALAQLVPATVFAPFAAALADRHPPARVLAAGYAAQAAAMGATAVALAAEAPPVLSYALAAIAATAVTVTRPTQAALIPGLARTPDELTAANVVSGWIESASVLAAPAATGVLLSVSGPAAVFAVMAAVALGSAAVVLPVPGPQPGAVDEPGGALAPVATGLRTLQHDPAARLLVLLLAAQFVAIGALDVLYVVLAVDVLGRDGSWAGYLNAAFGAGGVLAIAVTAALVGRRRLAPPLVLGLCVWAAAFAALGVWSQTLAALLLLAAAGAGRTVLDVAGRTLLQRSAPSDVLARIFGLLESLTMAGLAAGSLLAPLLVALAGAQGALVALGALLPVVAVAAGRRLLAIDRSATVPVVEIALLRSLPLFARLPPPSLEALARALTPIEAAAGDAVVNEGERGDRFYVVADGELEATSGGRTLRRLGRCDCFGEIALLNDVPRTGTVTAMTPSRLLALERDVFLSVVTGHPSAAEVAGSLVRERLAAAPDPGTV
jgi:MFS family permease